MYSVEGSVGRPIILGAGRHSPGVLPRRLLSFAAARQSTTCFYVPAKNARRR